MKTEPHLLRC